MRSRRERRSSAFLLVQKKRRGEIGQVIKYINDAVRVKDTFDNDVLEKFDSLEEI